MNRRGSSTQGRQRRLSPERRREQIIDTARNFIAQRGVARTTLREIAAAAEVSMGTVTYHFSGVDELFNAVVIREAEQFYRQAVAAAESDPDPWRALSALIDPMFTGSADAEAHWQIWTHFWAAVARRPAMAAGYADRIRVWEACCARVVARGVADGTFREVDPQQAALKMAAYSDGLGTQRGQGVSALTPELAGQWMHEFARSLLSPV